MSRGTRRGTGSAGRLAAHASTIAIMASVWGAGSTAVAQDDGGMILEEIMVTGTRIQASGMNTPTPVTAVDTDELNSMAPGNMVDGLTQLPQFYGSTTPASPGNFFSSPGTGNLNLRGLDTNRTLVLLDGRRLPSSTRYGGTDINVLPSEMIQRVETVTGGASAAYGTDAVAGVVNFILDTEYTGFAAHLQGGVTSRGDGENWEASVSFGTDIGDRMHVLFSAEAFEQEGVYTYEGRDWYESWGIISNPAATGGPTRLVRPDVVSLRNTLGGVIQAPGTSIDRLHFLENGTATPFILGEEHTPVAGFAGSQSHSVTNGGSGTDNAADRPTLMPDQNRYSSFAYLDFDVSDAVTVYAQGLLGRNRTNVTNLGGINHFLGQVTIFQDNAFLPEDLRQTMIDEGIDSFVLNRTGGSQDVAANAYTETKSTTFSGTIGLDAELHTDGLFDGWTAGAYYEYGRTKYRGLQWGSWRLDRGHLATDAVVDPATGSTVCRTTLFSDMYENCVPISLFGQGNASAEAVDYVTGFDPGVQIDTPLYYTTSGYDLGLTDSYTAKDAKQYRSNINQHVIEASASGEVWDGWGAGPVSAAFGAGYREESINQVVRSSSNQPSDHAFNYGGGQFGLRPIPANNPALGIRGAPFIDVNNSVGLQFSKVPNIMGSINVKEVFGEVLLPLVSGDSFVEQVNANGAARWADYSGSGGIWAWKAGLDAQFAGGFRLRGTLSRDVRAATLSERFDQTGGTANIFDPVTMTNVNPILVSGGNPEVDPEKADTITIGAVYQPTWFDGVSVSVDWYSVTINGAIGQLGPQEIVDRCEAGATDLCAQISRDPNTNTILLLEDIFINIDKSKVSGVDLEATYQTGLDLVGGGAETLGIRAFASWLDENSTSFGGAEKIDRAGQLGPDNAGLDIALPEWKATVNVTYNNGPFTLFVQERYIDGGTLDATWVEGVDVDDNSVSSAYYTDLRLSYTLQRGMGDIEVFGHVTNLLDKDPPVAAYYDSFSTMSNQTNPLVHDVLGRRFLGGIRLRY